MIYVNLTITEEGRLSRLNGEVDFLPDVSPATKSEFNKFLSKVDNILMGRYTFFQFIGNEEDNKLLNNKYLNKQLFVASEEKINDIVTLKGKPQEILKNMKGDLYLFGGPDIIGQFYDEGLIDEIHLSIIDIDISDDYKFDRYDQIKNDYQLKDVIEYSDFHSMKTYIYVKK